MRKVRISWAVTVALALTSCGGGGGGGGPVGPPVIDSFTADTAAVAVGETAVLTAVFSGGVGVVTPGSLPIQSGIPTTVDPTGTTTFVLTVTNADGVAVTASLGVQEFDAVVRNGDDAGPGSLRQALLDVQFGSLGGVVGIATSAPVLLSNPLPPIVVDVGIEPALGFGVTIDGQDLVRPFFVMDGALLRLSHLTVTRGLGKGGDGAASGFGGCGGGGGGMGGAVFVNGGALVCEDVVFLSNRALGGNGGSTPGGSVGGGGGGFGGNGSGAGPGGSGGYLGGSGGALDQAGGADGGGGGGGNLALPGQAGDAFAGGGGGGGAWAAAGGAGGFGAGGGGGSGRGGGAGAGGFGGGAGAVGGGTNFGGGGGGGAGMGGAIFVRSGFLSLVGCTFDTNAATGGAGGTFSTPGSPGQGLGGALFFLAPTLAFQQGTTYVGNAAGNDAGVPGNDDDVFGFFD